MQFPVHRFQLRCKGFVRGYPTYYIITGDKTAVTPQ